MDTPSSNQAAVDRIESFRKGALRIFAGPGTGKTYSLMLNIAALLKDRALPTEILLLTFTRLAAADLVKKVQELGIAGADQINATTIHSLSFSLLNREQVMKANHRVPRILNKFETLPLIHDLKHQGLGGITGIRGDIKAFESAWARCQTDQSGWPVTPHDKEFDKVLKSWLSFHNAMLVGELVPLALDYLRRSPGAEYFQQYKYILVDEYQDLNKAEQDLIDCMAAQTSLVVAGDDDQSIYGFKYAHPDGIISFDKHHKCQTETLEECRRCPRLVVRMARHLIERNETRYPKALKEKIGKLEGQVAVLQWNGVRKEAEGVGIITKYYIEEKDTLPGDVLILTQRGEIAGMISEELSKRSVPHRNYYSEDSFSRPIVQERITLAQLLAKPNNRVSLRLWLAGQSPTLNTGQYDVLRKYCEDHAEDPFDVLRNVKSRAVKLVGVDNLIERFDLLEQEIHRIGESKGEELVNKLFPKDEDEGFALINELLSPDISPDLTVSQLEKILVDRIAQIEIPEKRTEVSIMSLHKAKGLDANLVFLAGCVQGLIPYIPEGVDPSIRKRVLEESRRLFYVGVTRTKETLILSYPLYLQNVGLAKQMRVEYTGSRVPKLVPSSFLHDLGAECPPTVHGEDFLKQLAVE